ncbi:MAG: hypothetical protein ACO1OG_02830 [Devosia sp.]
MTAPTTPPYYGDMLGGREEGLPPDEGARWVVSDFAAIARYDPTWVWTERGLDVTIWPISGDGHASAEIGFSVGDTSGTIHLHPDESGYARVTVSIAGTEVLRLYVDRPYEEYEGHPPGASFNEKRVVDAPARMGKHQNWLQLRAEHWPHLGLADSYFSFEAKGWGDPVIDESP